LDPVLKASIVVEIAADRRDQPIHEKGSLKQLDKAAEI